MVLRCVVASELRDGEWTTFLFWKKNFGDEGYSFESGDVVALLLTGI